MNGAAPIVQHKMVNLFWVENPFRQMHICISLPKYSVRVQVDNTVWPHRHREAADSFPSLLDADFAPTSLQSSVLAGPAVMLTSSLQLPTGRVFYNNTQPIIRNNINLTQTAARPPTGPFTAATNSPVLVYGTLGLKSVSVSAPPPHQLQWVQIPGSSLGTDKTTLGNFHQLAAAVFPGGDKFLYVWGVGGQVVWVPAVFPSGACFLRQQGLQYCYFGQGQYSFNIRLTGTVSGRGVGTPVSLGVMETRCVFEFLIISILILIILHI